MSGSLVRDGIPAERPPAANEFGRIYICQFALKCVAYAEAATEATRRVALQISLNIDRLGNSYKL